MNRDDGPMGYGCVYLVLRISERYRKHYYTIFMHTYILYMMVPRLLECRSKPSSSAEISSVSTQHRKRE